MPRLKPDELAAAVEWATKHWKISPEQWDRHRDALLHLADELARAKRRIDAIRDIDLSDLDIGDPEDYGDKELAVLAGYWNISAAKDEVFRRADLHDNPPGTHRDDAARQAWEESR